MGFANRLEFNSKTSLALADRLRLLKYDSGETYKTLAVDAGVQFEGIDPHSKSYEQRLSRWMRKPENEFKLLGADNYKKLCIHLLKLHPEFKQHIGVPLLALARAPLYHAIAPILDIAKRSEAAETMRNRIVGAYKVYRPSMMRKNYGYIGRMLIECDRLSDSFLVTEAYKQPNAKGTFNLVGAAFPYSNELFATIAIDDEQKSIQLKYFNQFLTGLESMKDGRVQVSGFHGWVTSRVTHKTYITKIYAESIDRDVHFELKYGSITISGFYPPEVREALDQTLEREHSEINKYIYHE